MEPVYRKHGFVVEQNGCVFKGRAVGARCKETSIYLAPRLNVLFSVPSPAIFMRRCFRANINDDSKKKKLETKSILDLISQKTKTNCVLSGKENVLFKYS